MKSMSSTADRARQERVLAVALEVFRRYGFRKASMDEVARSADISRQGLYLHFASKEALFRAEFVARLTAGLRRIWRYDEEGAMTNIRIPEVSQWETRISPTPILI